MTPQKQGFAVSRCSTFCLKFSLAYLLTNGRLFKLMLSSLLMIAFSFVCSVKHDIKKTLFDVKKIVKIRNQFKQFLFERNKFA